MSDGAVLAPGSFALGLFGFAFASSAVYAYNDALDAPRDRLHQRNRERPVAAGRVTPAAARVAAAVLLAVGLALGAASGVPRALVWIGIYVGLNALYCHGGKHIPLLDVFLLSSGYLIRVLLGCALIPAAPSNWLLLCASTLALFLAFTKRRADLAAGVGAEQRPSLAGYSMAYLDQAMGFAAGITLLAYALYAIEAEVFVPGREFASLPFVAFGVLDVLRLAHVEGKGASPVDLALHEPTLLVCGAAWALAVSWSLGFW